jgi:serine phosphatase RsbU (regulator of sigma subunit)
MSEFAPHDSSAVNLRDLVGHREGVQKYEWLEGVHKRFEANGQEFIAVLNGDYVVGICSRHDVGMRLGARYGFSLFSRRPIQDFLSAAPLIVRVTDPIGEVLEAAFGRSKERFYDDVLLVEPDGTYVGLIYVHTLVRLQTQFLRANITVLEQQKQVIREKNQQLEDDITMAREIQLAMLPRENLIFSGNGRANSAFMRFSQIYRPAERVGGDFVHVAQLSPHSVGVFISDVMGHGVRSALVTAMLRALVQELGDEGTDAGELLTMINRDLGAILAPSDDLMFATAFYVIVDCHAGTLRYARAGHPCPMLLRRNTGTVEPLNCPREVSGPGLCLVGDAKYKTVETPLEGNDVILLYTDGLIEASDSVGNMFGSDRLRDSVRRNSALPTDALVEAILEEAKAHAEEQFDDDVCVAALSVGAE